MSHLDIIYLYIYIYIQRITMCPHGYHHSGSMATPALGTRDIYAICPVEWGEISTKQSVGKCKQINF